MTEMLWAVVLLVVGFVLLIKGADFFVEGSSSVAKMLKVPSIIIGLTIVAMGTSLPECAVSITASVTNNNALAVSNAIGSNIFNLMVVCGFCALFNPLYVEKSTLKKEFPFSVVCAVLLLVCGYLGMQLGRADGIILLIVFVAFLVWMVRSALKARAAAGDDEYEVFWFWMTKTIMKVSGQTDWFWWIFIAGLPFGIHKMRLILIPRGMDTTATLGMAALSVIIGALIGCIMIPVYVIRAVYVILRYIIGKQLNI